MGGGDLNLKKSWHPNTLKNQKRVYEAEQADAAERRKLAELQREIEHERNFEELRRIGQNSGVLATDDSKRLEWMYKGAENQLNREEYLTGRSIDKHFEEQDKAERQKDLVGVTVPKNHVEHECIPFSIRAFRGAPASEEQVDLQRKIMEDPLMMIQQREMERRQKLLENPVKLKEIHRLLQEDKRAKESSSQKKKKSKKSKKKRSHSDSDSDADHLDSELTRKYKQLLGEKGDHSMNIDKLLNEKYDKLSSELDKIKKSKKNDKKSKSKKKKKKRDSSSSSSDSDSESDHNRSRREPMRKEKKRGRSDSNSDRERRLRREPTRNDKKKRDARSRSRSDRDHRSRYEPTRRDEKKRERSESNTDRDRRSRREPIRREEKKRERSESNSDRDRRSRREPTRYDKKRRGSESDRDHRSRHESSRRDEKKRDTSKDLKLDRNHRSRPEPSKDDRKKKDSDSDRDHRSRRDSARNDKKKRDTRSESKSDKDRREPTSKPEEKKKPDTSSSSSSSDSDSDSDHKPRREPARNYGLVTAKGEKIALERKHETTFTPPAAQKKPTATYVPQQPRKKLTDDEKQERLREMAKNAKWHDQEQHINRLQNAERAKRDHEEESTREFDRNYIHKEMNKALNNQDSVEARLKSNKNNIQRMSNSMHSHFARK